MRQSGALALHVFCPWRLIRKETLVCGSGDLYTPADPKADLETFDWDVPGATWWDHRMAEVFAAPTPIVVREMAADPLGGFVLSCSSSIRLEAFPASADAPHIGTEYWRLFAPGTNEAHFVVAADGLHRDAEV